jgi:outer membrane protein assembly factor BamA
MRNIEKLAKYITKNGSEGIIIHSIPTTKHWLICQKTEKDKWNISMESPMGNTSYNLGTISTEEHLHLWKELIKTEIERKKNRILMAKELKERINNLRKKYVEIYKKFIKVEEKQSQNRKKPSRFQKTARRKILRIQNNPQRRNSI